MKRSDSKSGWKPFIFIAALAVILVAAGVVTYALLSRAPAPVLPAETDPAVTDLPDQNDLAPGDITEEQYRLNIFLSAVVRGDIENTATDLDEDAKLVRFVFKYRKYYAPESIIEEKEGDTVISRSLTSEQINETLTYFFGKTVNPDREDYSILTEDGRDFHCVYKNGRFYSVPPYPVEEFDFPLRFALAEKIDRETCTVHFRLYTMNVYDWFEGDAERHVPFLPLQDVFGAEHTNEVTKEWTKKIGEGDAVFRDLDGDLCLIEMTTVLD